MEVINGIPAHMLFLHGVVVLMPLTAVLEIICAFWPAARRGQLVWVTLALAVATAIVTPITIQAGNWLYDLRPNPTAILQEHAELGDTMIYFAVALLVVALALVALRVAERRDNTRRVLYKAIVTVVAVLVGVASMVQVYRVGDAGAKSVWSKEIAHLNQAKKG